MALFCGGFPAAEAKRVPSPDPGLSAWRSTISPRGDAPGDAIGPGKLDRAAGRNFPPSPRA
jgi:hypothetical protein